MYDNIVNFFNEESNLFEVSKNEFLKLNKNLKVNERLSINVPLRDSNIYPNENEIIVKSVLNELTLNFNKLYLNKIFDINNSYDFIDTRNNSVSNISPFSDMAKEIYFFLKENINDKYNNLVTNSQLAVFIQDFPEFVVHSNGQVQNGSNIYKIGKFLGCDVWVDPYMKWAENKIGLFSNIGYNFNNIKSIINNNHNTTANILSVSYGVSVNVGNAKVLYIIDSNNMHNDFKKMHRDIKITEILDKKN